MSPYSILGWALASVFATAIFALACAPRRKKADPIKYVPDNRVTFGKRRTGSHPGLSAPYGQQSRQRVFLSPRQIERINIQRKLRGKPPFNRAGLSNAIAHPWDRYDVRQPNTTNDWISYLIMYEILLSDHQSPMVSGCGGITIEPEKPYNGQGGEFAGAGASGEWYHADPALIQMAAGVEHNVPFVGAPFDPKYQPGDTVSGYGPTGGGSSYVSPSYVAPESPAYQAPSVSDSGSSYSSPSSSDSSSSSSSSSSDSSSSSSGGGGGD